MKRFKDSRINGKPPCLSEMRKHLLDLDTRLSKPDGSGDDSVPDYDYALLCTLWKSEDYPTTLYQKNIQQFVQQLHKIVGGEGASPRVLRAYATVMALMRLEDIKPCMLHAYKLSDAAAVELVYWTLLRYGLMDSIYNINGRVKVQLTVWNNVRRKVEKIRGNTLTARSARILGTLLQAIPPKDPTYPCPAAISAALYHAGPVYEEIASNYNHPVIGKALATWPEELWEPATGASLRWDVLNDLSLLHAAKGDLTVGGMLSEPGLPELLHNLNRFLSQGTDKHGPIPIYFYYGQCPYFVKWLNCEAWTGDEGALTWENLRNVCYALEYHLTQRKVQK